MSNQLKMAGYDEAKQKQYEQEIRQRYGEDAFRDVKDWNRYTPEKKNRIKSESEAIYTAIVANMAKGFDSPEVQSQIAAWHNHLKYFYEPSIERLKGLADLYNEHPDFIATFKSFHSDLPEFLRKAIQFYCKDKIDPK
jgi:hypothetical protein